MGPSPSPERAPRAARRAAATLALAACAACSLLTDLDGLGGADDAGGDAATAPDADVGAPAPPPPSDAAEEDAAPSPTLDAGPAACADLGDAALLCDEFDRDELASPQWEFVTRPSPDAGTLAIEPRDGGGRLLRVALPALPAGYAGQDEPHLRRDFEETPTRIVVAFDLARFDTGRASGRQIMLVRVNGTTPELPGGRAFLSFVDDRLEFVQQEARANGSTISQSLAALPAGTFGRYEITLDLTARLAQLRVDGALRVSVPLSAELRPSTFSVSAGFRFGGLPSAPVDVGLDRVVVTAQ